MLAAYCTLIFLILTIGQEASSQPVQENANVRPSQLYAGRTADFWVSEVIRLAIKIRNSEEEYDQNLGECMRQTSPQDQNSLTCIKANQAKWTASASRSEYQRLLNTVSKTSLPPDWLRAHFTWVRWGKEWKRD
jgi:hypothetical protein